MGQFCLGPCKRQPYDTDLRIPALAVGPGISPGQLPIVASIPDRESTARMSSLCLLPSLFCAGNGRLTACSDFHFCLRPVAPTFLDLCGAKSAIGELKMDGRSLLPFLRSNARSVLPSDDILAASGLTTWRDAHLVEYLATSGVVSKPPGKNHLKDSSNNTFIGLRIQNTTTNLAYFEFTDATTDWDFERVDFCEMYDLRKDPHQLQNICSRASVALRAELHAQLRDQFACAGPSCA